jgi:hypothetical protein
LYCHIEGMEKETLLKIFSMSDRKKKMMMMKGE